MSKKSLILYSCFTIIIAVGWFSYQKATDDTYEGMTIIPEQHKDIPLFDGLKPTDHKYVIKGNHWEDIYDFYMSKLPSLGWKVEHEESALDDSDHENDWSGFYSRWRKENFDGELGISVNYNQFDEETEVIFDKTPIYKSTSWVKESPNNICIYETLNQEGCFVIDDKSKVEEIKTLINKAVDWEKEELPNREKTSIIDFGNMEIKVYYGNDKEIYFQSKKGIKVMKPEPEFFELTSLSQ
ncbi:hypothetical protein [Oceanobacillus salinisoli]|uniref:hypothetical protein n=1 Tax=Oceanobacillus salinisoli TaxID=2678611 RepID=UPI0012E2C6E6|nr:hypothetical protein [Oceanobacillus salinisoli]